MRALACSRGNHGRRRYRCRDRQQRCDAVAGQALVVQDGRELMSADARTRHRLGGPSTVQAALVALLRDDATTRFIVVTRADELPRRETERLLRRLRRLQLSAPAIVVNARTLTPGRCARCRAVAAGIVALAAA